MRKLCLRSCVSVIQCIRLHTVERGTGFAQTSRTAAAAAAALIAKLMLLLLNPSLQHLPPTPTPHFSAQSSPAAFFLESLLRSSGPCSSAAPPPPPDSLPDGDSAMTAPALGLSFAQPAAILSCGKQQHSGVRTPGSLETFCLCPCLRPPHRIRDVGREAAAAARPARLTRAARAMRGVGIWGTGAGQRLADNL